MNRGLCFTNVKKKSKNILLPEQKVFFSYFWFTTAASFDCSNNIKCNYRVNKNVLMHTTKIMVYFELFHTQFGIFYKILSYVCKKLKCTPLQLDHTLNWQLAIEAIKKSD